MTDPQPDRARPQDLTAMLADGASYSLMVGLGETYVPAFALAIGQGEVVAGLIATVPMVFGALLQLLTPWALHHIGSYRRWTVACACLQALSFVPLVLGAAAGSMSLGWLLLAIVCYWGFGMATGPAWNTWVSTLVPVTLRARFFARRGRWSQAALIVAISGGGIALQWGREAGNELELFAWLFVGALLARVVSAHCLSRQSEAPGLVAQHRNEPAGGVLAAVRGGGHGRALLYLLGMQLSVNVAGPFFTPFMLGPLRLSYAQFMVLTAAAYVARVLVMPALGRLAQRRGTGPLLWFGAVGIVPIPALWIVSDAFTYLLLLQVLAGMAWASLELAMVLVFFDGIPERDRTRVLTAFNLANATAIATGAVLGTWLFLAMRHHPNVWWWLFGISSIGRLLMLPVLRGARAPRHPGVVELRTVAVRPSAGGIQRPILPTLEAPRGEGSAPP